VQTVDRAGRAEPPDPAKAPSQKICVDTKAPEAMLGGNWRGQEVEVWWVVRDENLDLKTLRIIYREAGRSGTWHQLKVPPKAEGKIRWKPETAGAMEVGLQVGDRAGNKTEAIGVVEAPKPE
jgi:hypothetical protein